MKASTFTLTLLAFLTLAVRFSATWYTAKKRRDNTAGFQTRPLGYFFK
ncbi:hypothetical protein ACNTMW_09445 [Planosporangium sp. 12N6]